MLLVSLYVEGLFFPTKNKFTVKKKKQYYRELIFHYEKDSLDQ